MSGNGMIWTPWGEQPCPDKTEDIVSADGKTAEQILMELDGFRLPTSGEWDALRHIHGFPPGLYLTGTFVDFRTASCYDPHDKERTDPLRGTYAGMVSELPVLNERGGLMTDDRFHLVARHRERMPLPDVPGKVMGMRGCIDTFFDVIYGVKNARKARAGELAAAEVFLRRPLDGLVAVVRGDNSEFHNQDAGAAHIWLVYQTDHALPKGSFYTPIKDPDYRRMVVTHEHEAAGNAASGQRVIS
jgi:hypothetical protein